MLIAGALALLPCGVATLALDSPTPPPGGVTMDSLRRAIDARVAAVPGAVVAVAYHDLTTGDTLWMNADDEFHAASTMKVPVMIELFRRVDAGQLSLGQQILLVNQFASIVDGSPYSLDSADDSDTELYHHVGARIPIENLLERMIERSSNLATNTVIATLGAARVDSTAHEMGASHMHVLRGVEDGRAFDQGLNNRTTARDLAVLMTAIADDHAASKASCARMRAILLKQEFSDEIPAGLPPGTPVAHKTGWITGVLHDAAIVYPRGRGPYVLVVLTRGIPEQKVAQSLIADVSRLVYASAMSPAGRG